MKPSGLFRALSLICRYEKSPRRGFAEGQREGLEERTNQTLFNESVEFASGIELAGIEQGIGVTTDLCESVSSQLADDGSFFAQVVVNDDIDIILNEFGELLEVLAGESRHIFNLLCDCG